MTLLLALFLLVPCGLICAELEIVSIAPAVGGWKPKMDEYNWAAGVHRRKDDGTFGHICGGSLISTRLVLSAAHCFWNNGREVIRDQYRISAGNFNRDPDADYNTQKKEVKEIIFHPRYRGRDLNYAHDIVIVVLTEDIYLNDIVATIEVDWRAEFEDNSLKDQYGTVVGWGFTELDLPSESRVAVGLPFVDFDNCYDVVPREFRSSLTPDKFCAGLRNGTAVCPGDSGGGLAFLNTQDSKWYLRGIVSVGVRPDDNSKCHKTQYSAFTSISHYRTWLEDKLRELYTSSWTTENNQWSTTEHVETFAS